MKKFPFATVIKAGLFVGSLDILAAFIQYYINNHKNPLVVAKFIASGVFGQAAFNNGNSMIIWGLLVHFFIATSFTFLFFFLANRFPGILRSPILTGIVYGCFVWSVMQFIVLPLANTPPISLKPMRALIAILILIVCIGIPLAYIARLARRKPSFP